nr:MAG TPA: hypothetical protein [Inoviridae sp.]
MRPAHPRLRGMATAYNTGALPQPPRGFKH